MTPAQSAAFGVAAAWSAVLTDLITVKLNIGLRDLGRNGSGGLILGGASPVFVTAGYGAFELGLTDDATSASDGMAVAASTALVLAGLGMLRFWRRGAQG